MFQGPLKAHKITKIRYGGNVLRNAEEVSVVPVPVGGGVGEGRCTDIRYDENSGFFYLYGNDNKAYMAIPVTSVVHVEIVQEIGA